MGKCKFLREKLHGYQETNESSIEDVQRATPAGLKRLLNPRSELGMIQVDAENTARKDVQRG